MDVNRIIKTLSFSRNILIMVSIFSPIVNALPFLDEIRSITSNKDILKILNNQIEVPLGVSPEILNNLRKRKDFDFLGDGAEQTIKSICDRIQNLFILPFNHPIVRETKNESEIFRGDCQAPNKCFTKKQGTNLCTICEEDMSAATELIDFFQEAKSADELLDMGEKCKHVLNEYLFNYALTYLLITKFPDFEYPSIVEVFPELFIKKDELDNINKEMDEKHRHKRMTDTSDMFTVHVRPTFDSRSVTYFTEDYGYNSNHWNWHIIHRAHSGIDRRGELFWFMHHQMLARYDIERMSLGINRVESTGPLDRTIKFGYFPNLDSSENGQEWPGRQDNIFPTSIRSNGIVTHDVNDLKLWHGRLSKAARDGFMISDNGDPPVILSDDTDVNSGAKRGIDIFTGAAESDPVINPNSDYYGGLHNHGHRIIARLHDPESQGSSLGIMSSAAVSARDPSFYQWHKYFEEVIQDYKITQPPYPHERLELTNVFLSDVQIAVDSESLLSYKRQNSENNLEYIDSKILEDAKRINIGTELLTGCNTYGVDISRGVDFGHTENKVIIEFTHLDHIPFYYDIHVHNAWHASKNVMVRIFLAPMYGADGLRLQLHKQQHLFIILDKFKYTLSPGENVIHRLSTESSITSNCRNSRRDSEKQSYSSSGVFGGGHCGCGWPHHLLLPRGRPHGMMFQIFVLLTDWDHDYIYSESEVKEFCGQSGEKYPDWQPMGYPFDRPFHQDIYFVDQLADYLINAHVSNVSIRFTGRNLLTDEFTC